MGNSGCNPSYSQRLVARLTLQCLLVADGIVAVARDGPNYLCTVHIARQVSEGHFRLNHPELCQVARCVAVLGSEGWT